MKEGNSFIASLQKVKSELKRLERPAAEKFQEGMDPAEFKRQTSWITTPIPLGLESWYSQWNGMDWTAGDTADDLAVIPGFYLLSCEEARQSAADYQGRLKKGWFPILENAGGDFYAVEAPIGKKASGRVFFSPSYDEAESVYDSLETMAESIATCMERGAYFIDENGDFEIDDDLEFEICGELNPKSAYWK